MSADAATSRRRLFHEAAFYGSDDEFLDVVVPLLTSGVEVDETTMATFGGEKAELIRSAVGDATDIAWVDADLHYTRPANAIRGYRERLAESMAGGARQIRVVAEIPHPGTGLPWAWWARYESAFNHIFDDFPVWVVCTYDTRTTPAEVLADVARTHPHLTSADGRHLANPRFEDPMSFLSRNPAGAADPLEAGPPLIDLVHPTPAEARRAIQAANQAGRLDADVTDLVFTVNEAVTNAIYHGRPPVRLRIWSGPDRMVATVTDRGPGPTDPFAGLLPPANSPPDGVGLWLIHQICSNVTLGTDADGFTIRLVTGAGIPGSAPTASLS